jgi:NADPH-dependent ferric siderophore reductase
VVQATRLVGVRNLLPVPPQAKMSAKRTPPRVATVRRREQLTPQMVRLVLGGDGLDGFAAGPFADHYVKLQIPPPEAPYGARFDIERVKAEQPRELWPRVRTYSVRNWDPERLELTIDFVVHGSSGVAGPWAAAAEAGDEIQLVGPGGAYTPDPEASAHLLVGDACVLPAISVALGRIPSAVPVRVIASVAGPEEELHLESPGDLEITWIHRDPAAEMDAEPMLDAVAGLDLPDDGVQCFVHGEAGAVREIRRHLLGERGLPLSEVSISGYWKRRRTEEGWREDKQEWNRLVERDLAAAGPL